jgi:hypothetical protein
MFINDRPLNLPIVIDYIFFPISTFGYVLLRTVFEKFVLGFLITSKLEF